MLLAVTLLPIQASPAYADDQELVTICHKPGANEVTIGVALASLDAHLRHGDRDGSCGEEFKVCPFETFTITLTSPDPVKIPVELTENGQDLNFGANDPPGVYWAITDLDGNVLLNDGPDDHLHFNWGGIDFSDAGQYYVLFSHPAAGSTYPSIQVNLACNFDAPEP